MVRAKRTFLVFETAATKVDNLDGTLGGVAKKDVLHVTSAMETTMM